MKKLLFILFPLLLSACGQTIEGTYSNNMTGIAEQKVSWTFNPDGTAQMSVGSTKFPIFMPFEVSGNEVIVEGENGDNVFTILQDGSLVINGLKFTKETATAATQQTAVKEVTTIDPQMHQAEAKPESNEATSPSFDCEKASTQAERLICSDAELSALDAQMMALYQRLAEIQSDDSLKKEQRKWIKEDRDTCPDARCMALFYRSRINKLEIIAQNAKPADFR